MRSSWKFLGVVALISSFSVNATTTLNIWQPEPNQNLPADNWTTFSGAATSSRGVAEVKYYLNGVPFCTINQAPYNCSYKTPQSGSFSLKMTATGYDGTYAEKTVQFSVGSGGTYTPPTSTTAVTPSISILYPGNGEVFKPDFWTTLTSSGSNVASLTYYANGVKVCSVSSSPYNCSYKTPASGPVTIKAVAVSSSGHSAEKTISISIEGSTQTPPPVTSGPTVIPTVAIYSPENGKVFDPEFWTTLTGGATNAESVKFYIDGVLFCAKTSEPYNCSYKTPSTGSVSIKAVATSSSGHTAEKSVVISVNGTVTPPPTTGPVIVPTVSLIEPKNNQSFSADFWTTLTGSATNAAKVEYFANGVRVCTKTSAPFNCSYKTPMSGSVTIKAVATSSSGHTAEQSAVLVVNGSTTTPTPTPEPEPTPTPTPGTGVQVPAGYTLYFHDEFDNNFNGAPNPQFWDYDVNYVRNEEAQCYTTNRRENVRVENRNIEGFNNGYLVLELRKEQWPCPQNQNKVHSYTSGAITTRKRGWKEHLVDMPHGRYEIRAKIPSGRGTWPAIWLLGSSSLGSWPDSGEIDIMEAVGYEEAAGKYVLHSTLHRNSKFGWPNKWGTSGQGMHYVMTEPPSARFHTWVMEWTPNSIEFFVDGKRVTKLLVAGDVYQERLGFFRSEFAGTETAHGWPYSRETPGHKWELILNLAHGGLWGGIKGLDDTIFANGKKVEMLVDYVRVYKKNP